MKAYTVDKVIIVYINKHNIYRNHIRHIYQNDMVFKRYTFPPWSLQDLKAFLRHVALEAGFGGNYAFSDLELEIEQRFQVHACIRVFVIVVRCSVHGGYRLYCFVQSYSETCAASWCYNETHHCRLNWGTCLYSVAEWHISIFSPLQIKLGDGLNGLGTAIKESLAIYGAANTMLTPVKHPANTILTPC